MGRAGGAATDAPTVEFLEERRKKAEEAKALILAQMDATRQRKELEQEMEEASIERPTGTPWLKEESPTEKADREKAVAMLKERLDSNQRVMSEKLRSIMARPIEKRPYVINASRQIGKSFWMLDECLQFAMENPRFHIKYAAPTGKMVKLILKPHLDDILRPIPPYQRPKDNYWLSQYTWTNGSTLTIFGCDGGNIDYGRGQHAHLGVVDEAGFVDDLENVVKNVLMPQTLNTRGKVVILSTPAKTPGHYFTKMCEDAEAEDMLFTRTIYDNPRMTPEDISATMKACGGEKSSTWRREYLCQHVPDERLAAFPEATMDRLMALSA